MAKKMSPEPPPLPADVSTIADDLADITARHFADHGSRPVRRAGSGPREVDWAEMIGEGRPSNIEEWSWRDIATWFSSECKKGFIPFVLNYERDISIIKGIHSDMSSIGRDKKADVRDLISWALENQSHVLDEEGSFTLSTIRHCINTYVQRQTVALGDGERKIGRDLVKAMKMEYAENRTAGIILRYGIPLSAAMFRMLRPDFPVEKIARGIADRLQIWMDNDDLESIRDIARKSITSSPYPDAFPLLDWRERFIALWVKSASVKQGWWREDDYEGRPYVEYESLLISSNESEDNHE